MFLIYNFHLTQGRALDLVERFQADISFVIGRELTKGDYLNMEAYGLEATMYAGLKQSLVENHLLEGWKKMNRLWTLVNSNFEDGKFLKLDGNDKCLEKKFLYDLNYSVQNNNFYKIATNIDHIIKLPLTKHIILEFLQIIKPFFPFLVRSIGCF